MFTGKNDRFWQGGSGRKFLAQLPVSTKVVHIRQVAQGNWSGTEVADTETNWIDFYISLTPVAQTGIWAGVAVAAFFTLRKPLRQLVEELVSRVNQGDDVTTPLLSLAKPEKLTAENEALRSQLEDALLASGITIDSIVAGGAINQVGSELSQKIDDLIKRMEQVEGQGAPVRNPEWHLELAKGHMARRRWSDAAEHFDAYVTTRPEDFRSQLSRGVAYANLRGGQGTNLRALRAYNEAIVFADDGAEAWLGARLFIYRGAMLKRLGRLEESEADLLIGKTRATTEYEALDAEYNLACIYAMRNDRAQLFTTLERLSGAKRELGAIRSHLDDYFSSFATDEEFLRLIQAPEPASL